MMKPNVRLWAWINGKRYTRKWINLYALSALIILLSLVTSSAQGAVPPRTPDAPSAPNAAWNIHVVDGAIAIPPTFPLSLRFMTDRSLAFRKDNIPCAAYGGDYLFYSCWNNATQKWDTQRVDNDYLTGAYAALAFDFNSHPFISYYDAAKGDLKLAYNLGAGWVTMVVESNPLPYIVTGTGSSASEDIASPELQALRQLVDSLFGGSQQTDSVQQVDVASQVDDSIGVGKHTSIALDVYDNVHISYYDEVNRDLKYAFWQRFIPPSSWTIETVDYYNDQGVVGTHSSIAVDQNARPHIAYMSEKYDDLKYARRTSSGEWQVYDVDRSDFHVGSYASLALQEVGISVFPHISYLDFSGYNLKYAYLDSNFQWVKEAIDTPGVVGLFTSIARGTDGKVWISYYDQTNGDLKYASITSAGAKTVKTIYKDNNVGFYTSIALNKSLNKPGIVYGDFTHNTLNYTYLNTDNKWIYSLINNDYYFGSNLGLNTSLAINGFGEPVISYRDLNTNALKYALHPSASWELGLANQGVSDGQHSSVAWIDDYHPVMAFYNQTSGDLVYAAWNLISHKWDTVMVDAVGDVGQYVSLAIDSGKNPHMSYYDVTNGDLKYAFWDPVGSAWVITTVDSISDIGYFSSLVLDTSDRPYISYFDRTNEQIKYAYKNPTWQKYVLKQVSTSVDDIVVSEAYTSMGVFDDGVNPPLMRIAFYDDKEKDLIFAVANTQFPTGAADWAIAPLDSTGSVGKYVSMAIKPGTDDRHLCYYDATNGDLRYAKGNGVFWTLEIVESIGDVGQYCSIALNSVGEPAISYNDASWGKLKYASTFAMPLARSYIPMVITP